MRIEELTVRDLWSFGDQQVTLSDIGQTTVIIGKNNSGKSNLFRCIKWFADHSALLGDNKPCSFNDRETHDYGENQALAQPALLLKCRLTPEELDKYSAPNDESIAPEIWRSVQENLLPGFVANVDTRIHHTVKLSTRKGATLNPFATDGHGKGIQQKPWATAVSLVIDRTRVFLRDNIKVITGWRTLDSTTFDKETLIARLAASKDPEHAQRDRRKWFVDVQSAFQRFSQMDEAKFSPTNNGAQLNISWRGHYFPIDGFGDGIQHLLMLAAEFTYRSGYVFLVEEPETHLHPGLQRHLLDIMRENKYNQFIVTTHSPVLLDSGKAPCIFRVEHDGDTTSVTKCVETQDMYRALDQLGARASDILQANVVIWVEGPTDRMFLKRCFELRGDKYTEGIHYQIAYYGGALRAHVAVGSDDPGLVNLLSVSRNAIVVCDSDRTKTDDTLSATKQRIETECENTGCEFWATGGREIENYIPNAILSSVYRGLLADESIEIQLDQYDKLDDVLGAQFPAPAHGTKWMVDYGSNKVKLMPRFLKAMGKEHLTQHGLKGQLDKIITYIDQANSAAVAET